MGIEYDIPYSLFGSKHNISVMSETQPIGDNLTQKESRDKSRKWNIIRAIGLILIAGIALGWYYFSKKSSQKKEFHTTVFFQGNVEIEQGTNVIHGRTIVGSVVSVQRIPLAMQLLITSKKNMFERQAVTVFP